MKLSLEKAYPLYLSFKENVMRMRKEDHANRIKNFIDKVGNEVKQKIFEEAKSELKKVDNLRKVKEADDKRRQNDEAKRQANKLAGIIDAPTTEAGGWTRE